jgi:gliding motility-associated-like protein
MKRIVLITLIYLQAIAQLFAQSTTCPWVNAGIDQTICAPNCATLNMTYLQANATTSYTQAVIPYAPDPFNVGTTVALTDDSQTGLLTLPFTFCFYGTAYNQFIIGSNGWVGFTATTSTWVITNPVPDGSGASPRNCIMGPWQDINPSVGGTIRYQLYGSAPCRRMTVSWLNVPMYSCGTPATQQIILYETTNIIDNFIQTKPLCAGWNSGRAIQATHNAAGTVATVVPGRNSPTQWAVNNEGRRFSPAGAPTTNISWLNSANVVIGNTASIQVCPTTTSTYTAQIVYTNCNNTTTVVTDQVVVNVSSVTVNVNPSNVQICLAGNVQLSANAANAVTYSWTPATFLNNPNIANPVSTPTATTTYTVYVTDANGCQGTATVTVTVTQMTTANAGPDVSICYGGNTQLNASGGVVYSWAPATFLNNPNIANPVSTPTATTTYTVYVTDANGCQGSDMVTVTVNPQITLNVAGFDMTCANSCNGQAIVIPNGGTQPFSYLWSNGGTTAAITGLCAGTYTITVTDAAGCTMQGTATVNAPPALVLQTNSTNANCGLPDGSACVVINGGTPPYSQVWSPSNQTTLCATNVPPGTYTVTVTDANGCTDTAVVIVNNNAGGTASITAQTNVTCFGACDGTATTTMVGGQGPYTYTWSTNPVQYTQIATGLCAGTYTATVVDDNGCSDTAIVIITQPVQLTIVAIPSVIICTGTCTTLVANPNGGTPAYAYLWMPGNLNTSSIQACPTSTTTYTVTVTDANGCTNLQTTTVTVRPPLTVNIANGATVCPGACTSLTANGAGGNGGPYTYLWMPGNLTGQTVQVCPTATTTYTVTVNDNCTTPTATDTATVIIQPPPVVSFTSSDSSGCAPLCVTFNGTAANASSWSWTFTGGNPSSSIVQNTSLICYDNPGQYNVTLFVTDNNGCTASATVNNMITVYSNPTAAFSMDPQTTTVLNGTINFTDNSIGATQWTWSFGDINAGTSNNQNPIYTYLDTGAYIITLLVANQYGCVDTIENTVVILPEYTFFAPNAFTPNGDGRNDVFMPKGDYVDANDFEFYVFDRWGMMIFKTEKWGEGWNGKVNGNGDIVQQDVYVWKVITKDNLGNRHEYVGHVSVIK